MVGGRVNDGHGVPHDGQMKHIKGSVVGGHPVGGLVVGGHSVGGLVVVVSMVGGKSLGSGFMQVVQTVGAQQFKPVGGLL